MNFSIQTIIRAFVAPKHKLSCSKRLWYQGLEQLRIRGNGQRESGAFLLGVEQKGCRQVRQFVYYNDLDPKCLATGIVVFDGAGYGPLWNLCDEKGLKVVADVHTHPGLPYQSATDKRHPMIATVGHLALIVPNYAKKRINARDLGIYEYMGKHQWLNHSGSDASSYFYIGTWG